MSDVSESVYLSAVKGRQDFRRALIEERKISAKLRAAIIEARRRLAKGRALWNGPSHETDAVLREALDDYIKTEPFK